MPQVEQDILLDRLVEDHTRADLPPLDRAILDYAAKLTTAPQSMGRPDVASLREAGLDDRGIHDVACIAAYFAFVNRVADGLGVELEDRFGDEA